MLVIKRLLLSSRNSRRRLNSWLVSLELEALHVHGLVHNGRLDVLRLLYSAARLRGTTMFFETVPRLRIYSHLSSIYGAQGASVVGHSEHLRSSSREHIQPFLAVSRAAGVLVPVIRHGTVPILTTQALLKLHDLVVGFVLAS